MCTSYIVPSRPHPAGCSLSFLRVVQGWGLVILIAFLVLESLLCYPRDTATPVVAHFPTMWLDIWWPSLSQSYRRPPPREVQGGASDLKGKRFLLKKLLCISLTSIDHNQRSHEESMSHLPLWVKLSGISDSPALSSLHIPATELPHLQMPEETWTSKVRLWPHFLHTRCKLRGPNSCVSSTQKHAATHSSKPDP